MQNRTLSFSEEHLNSHLSFRPLINALKKNVADASPGIQKLYGRVLTEFESHSELMGNIPDVGVLLPHSELIEELLASVFPPTAASSESLYAVALPFKFQTVFSSKLFHHLFLKPGTAEINIPDDSTGANLSREKFEFAYGMILKKYLGYNNPDTCGWIHPYKDPHTGLTKYMELMIDARFIDVNPIGEMPSLPESILCRHSNRIQTLDELIEQIPLNQFNFEGISIVRVNDVTQEEVISRIKTSLLSINDLSDDEVYEELEGHVQSLIGLKNVKIGITPFFKVNGHYVYSDVHNNSSLLFKHFKARADKDEVSDWCKLVFKESDRPMVFETLNEDTLSEMVHLQHYHKEGGRSLIVCPLKMGNDLFGILEIMSPDAKQLKHTHVSRIQPVIPLFTLGLEKSLEMLKNEIDKVIKEKFTAVQPAVEWKFTEAALNYIVNSQDNPDVKIDRIAFPEVYPLYGSMDIRNSSTERAHAIQLDLIEQLELASKVVKKAQSDMPFPLLQEIEYKIDKFIASASDVLQSDEELSIYEFMQGQVVSIFNHLHSTQPSVKNEVEHYFASLDPQLGMLYHHRKEYEQSISKINDTLARFIDKEQASAQKVYPHYFERYVTDGT